ncbi:MAG: PAS domain S-box protein, partial [Anaerolineae bacterium]|nr:PAS domain S-box protein [Anaerolineae bacterium]
MKRFFEAHDVQPPRRCKRRTWPFLLRLFLLAATLAVTAILAAMAGAAAPIPQSGDPRRVLVLQSYDPTFPWTRNVMSGIESVFLDSDLKVELSIEYMDTKRTPPEEVFPYLAELYAVKYGDVVFDAILLSDNNALDFALTYRDALFPGAPVVFCGINNFTPALLRGQTGVTGVVEDLGLKETIDLALTLHPEADLVAVINDATPTGVANQARFHEILPDYGDRFAVLELVDVTAEDLQAQLQALPETAIVLQFSFHRDAAGRQFTLEEYTELVTASTTRPIYTFWQYHLHPDIVGGVVISGRAQGATAARMVDRLLRGESVEAMPIVLGSPNMPMFNYPALQRFDIALKDLPQGATLLNEPDTFLYRYKRLVIPIVVFIVAQMLVIVALVGNFVQRRRTQVALEESESKYRLLIENQTDLIIKFDADFRLRYVNPAYCAVFGRREESLLGRPLTELIDDSERERIVSGIRRVSEPPYTSTQEERALTVDGWRWFSWSNRAVLDAEGQVIEIIGVGRDITERKQIAEEREALLEEIQTQAQRMRQIMNTVPEGVLLLDAKQRVVLSNPVAERDLTLLAPGAALAPLTHLGDRPVEALLARPPKGQWHEARAKDRIFEVIARPVASGPQPAGWVLVLRDVTDARAVEQRAQQRERLAAVGQLAAGIAHDFNNILAVIALYADMTQRTPRLPPVALQRLTVISRQTQNAAELIGQLLDFSRQAVFERRPLALGDFVTEQLALFKRTLPDDIQVQFDASPGDAYTIEADPTRIQQVLVNLMLNARDAMPGGGALRIALARLSFASPRQTPLPAMPAGTWIRLTVEDTGVGIPKEVLPRIFDPFFTTKEPGKGSGLGLAQVHGIIGSHRGYIDVQSEEGMGSTFNLYFPAFEAAAGAPAAPHPHGMPVGRGETILVVEDNQAARGALVDSLAFLHYTTVEAVDGQNALEILESHPGPIALVLTDVTMPRMSGTALIQAMRQRGHTMPVILISGQPTEDILDAPQGENAAAWLMKPVDLEQLARTLAEGI